MKRLTHWVREAKPTIPEFSPPEGAEERVSTSEGVPFKMTFPPFLVTQWVCSFILWTQKIPTRQ